MDYYLIPTDVLAEHIALQDSLAMRPTTPGEHAWAASLWLVPTRCECCGGVTASRDGHPVICPACVIELEACRSCPERRTATPEGGRSVST